MSPPNASVFGTGDKGNDSMSETATNIQETPVPKEPIVQRPFEQFVEKSNASCRGGIGCRCCYAGCDCGCRNHCPKFRGMLSVQWRNQT